ncbi:glycosyltransferase family 90 protein [Melanogaster broomeanus]|nr:glycosyltransferase family 90 protein [Melanogaster broomeanus]
MADAERKFRTLLEKQSRTLPDAVAEYKRRYGRDPPRGFDEWWQFAKDHDLKLVDEFDAIVAGPRAVLGVKRRGAASESVGQLPSIDLVRIQDGNVFDVKIEKAYKDTEKSRRAIGFRQLFKSSTTRQIRALLPDMDFPINAKAEGRVLVPWEHQKYPNLTVQDSSGGVTSMVGHFTPDWKGQGSVWEAYRRTPTPINPECLLGPPTRSSDAFFFAETVDDHFDFCQNPWAHYAQGHFFSDWRTIPVLYPVFSPAKVTGFADIRIPSHYYHRQSTGYTYGWDAENLVPKEIDDMEMPWNEKSEVIFWRGATTGGGSTPPGFSPSYQRHRYFLLLRLDVTQRINILRCIRFLRMAHENSSAKYNIVHASPSNPGSFISTTVPAKDLNRDLFDVAFVSAVGDYPGGEQALRKVHRFAESVPLGKHWSYKYLIDFDGMSYSARFMAFMSSDSAVIKSTVYQEFFSDWLQPWLHYIPLSSSYSEIYNIHAYFSGASDSTIDIANATSPTTSDWRARKKEGDEQLRRIARAGKQWRNTIGRTVDMEAYVYRLCLEYARLWADDRDTMNFVL